MQRDLSLQVLQENGTGQEEHNRQLPTSSRGKDNLLFVIVVGKPAHVVCCNGIFQIR